MTARKQASRVSVAAAAPKSGRTKHKVAPVPTASSATTPAPHRRFRTPERCTMGYLHYQERIGEQREGRAVPKLRLSGRWLEQCGFAVGDELQVTVGRGVLLVSLRKTRAR